MKSLTGKELFDAITRLNECFEGMRKIIAGAEARAAAEKPPAPGQHLPRG